MGVIYILHIYQKRRLIKGRDPGKSSSTETRDRSPGTKTPITVFRGSSPACYPTSPHLMNSDRGTCRSKLVQFSHKFFYHLSNISNLRPLYSLSNHMSGLARTLGFIEGSTTAGIRSRVYHISIYDCLNHWTTVAESTYQPLFGCSTQELDEFPRDATDNYNFNNSNAILNICILLFSVGNS